jgi:16S rRNA (cytidine1402-2'-O)-methyltransferase
MPIMKSVSFYTVATPLGNLGDFTFRAVKVLQNEVDLILCEDTRRSRKLLDHYGIKTATTSYHQRSGTKKADHVIQLLKEGKSLALLTDAGTPGVSDPGNELIAKISGELPSQVEITPLPGACALTTLAQVAGVNLSEFCFLGFPPNKKGRRKFFSRLLEVRKPVFYYDSPYRIKKNLILLQELSTDKEISLQLVVGNELTKFFEKILRGSLEEVISQLGTEEFPIKGEFTVLAH